LSSEKKKNYSISPNIRADDGMAAIASATDIEKRFRVDYRFSAIRTILVTG
jgi:hypothetical protein